MNYLNKKGNKDGEHDRLLDTMNQSDEIGRLQKLMDWIDSNNSDGKWNNLIEYLNGLERPKLLNVLRYATINNRDGIYDALIAKILGRKFNPKSLLEILHKYNRDGKFNQLIKYLEENPSITLDQLLDKMERENDDGKYDDLFEYLLGENDDYNPHPRKLREKLEDLISSGDYPDAKNYIKKEGIEDPYRLLDWLRENNVNGKYDDIIRDLE